MDTIPLSGSEFYTETEACENWHKQHPEPESYPDHEMKRIQDEEYNRYKGKKEPLSYPIGWRHTQCPYCKKINWK